jgi:hypothetical protein
MTNHRSIPSSYFSFFLVVAVAVLSRFIPHYPNMTAVGALAVYSGFAGRPRWMGFGFVMTALLFTDWILGFHNTMFYTYGAWILVSVVSSFGLRQFSWVKLMGMGLLSASVFFVISNFGFWMTGILYPKTAQGLLECYLAAVPFFENQLVGDIAFSLGLFAVHFAIEKLTEFQLVSEK